MRKKAAAYLCMGLVLLMTAGCGNSNAGQDAKTADAINYSDTIDADTEENNSSRQSDSQSSEESINNQPNDSVENGDSQENNNEDIAQQSNSIQTQTDVAQSQPDTGTSQADDAQQQSDSELDGNIESIGDNSVTISKTLHPSENLAVSSNELVTVYFSEETEYEIRTVKNGGVNGDADVEKRQGAFSDLNLGASINMTGSYDGSDFYAEYVIIYNFV